MHISEELLRERVGGFIIIYTGEVLGEKEGVGIFNIVPQIGRFLWSEPSVKKRRGGVVVIRLCDKPNWLPVCFLKNHNPKEINGRVICFIYFIYFHWDM